MSEEWDFYFCRINDQPASIYLNMGLWSEAPIASQPHVVRVRVPMLSPREDGLSSQQEFDDLVRLENSITGSIKGWPAVFAGRTTQGGVRDFYFYSNDPDGVTDAISSAATSFPAYALEIGSFEDPQWEEYLGFLYPSARDRERMANRRTIDALEREGDNLTTPRQIDHWIYLPSASVANDFLFAASKLGFSSTGEIAKVEGMLGYQAVVSSVAVPDLNDMNEITLQLLELAQAHDGDYDGWECSVETGQ